MDDPEQDFIVLNDNLKNASYGLLKFKRSCCQENDEADKSGKMEAIGYKEMIQHIKDCELNRNISCPLGCNSLLRF